MAKNDNRWWEYYLARYIAANIFAVLVLFYLVTFEGMNIKKSLCKANSNSTWCFKSSNFSDDVYSFIFQTTKDVKSTNDTANIDRTSITNKICFFSIDCNYVFLPVPNNAQFKNNIAVDDSGFILNKSSQINITEINFSNIFVLGVFGFLYMYISSLPIYFLHITRGAWIDIPKNGNNNYNDLFCPLNIIWKCKLLLIFIMIFIFLILIYFCLYLAPITLLILLLRLDNIYDYLKNSTFKRDKILNINKDESQKIIVALFHSDKRLQDVSANSFSPEYITSYKHVREHGNAFGIILMEILFALFLIKSDFSIWAIVSWLILGFSGWFIGIYLEDKMLYSEN